MLEELGVRYRTGVPLGPHRFCCDFVLAGGGLLDGKVAWGSPADESQLAGKTRHAADAAEATAADAADTAVDDPSLSRTALGQVPTEQGHVALLLGHDSTCRVNGEARPLGELAVTNRLLVASGVRVLLVPQRQWKELEGKRTATKSVYQKHFIRKLLEKGLGIELGSEG